MFPDTARPAASDARSAPEPHRFDPGSLLSAALFAAVAVVGLSGQTVSLGRELRWLWPILFLGSGIALLVSVASRSREPTDPTDRTDPTGPTDIPGPTVRP